MAELSWVERKAASAFFATPPEATYEEALGEMLLTLFSFSVSIRTVAIITEAKTDLDQEKEY